MRLWASAGLSNGAWGADVGTGRRGLRMSGAPSGVAVGVRRADGVSPGMEGDMRRWASAAADKAIRRHSSSGLVTG